MHFWRQIRDYFWLQSHGEVGLKKQTQRNLKNVMRDQQVTVWTDVQKDVKYDINIHWQLGYSLQSIF